MNTRWCYRMAGALAAVVLLGGCSESSAGGDTAPPADTTTPILVDGPEDLMSALDIPGATVASGSIPAPDGTPGTTLSLDSEEMIVTANSEYNLGYSVEGGADDPSFLYLQFDGVDQHFVIDLSEPITASTARPIRGRPGLTPSGEYEGSALETTATVRSFSPPLQAGVPDMSFITDSSRWSNPATIRTRVVSVGSGSLQISLTWNTTADLDLWVEEPDGNRIWYVSKVSSTTGGELDVDDIDGFGPENVFYEDLPPAGDYVVKVDHFSGASPTGYTVTITDSGATRSFTGSISSDQTLTIDTIRPGTQGGGGGSDGGDTSDSGDTSDGGDSGDTSGGGSGLATARVRLTNSHGGGQFYNGVRLDPIGSLNEAVSWSNISAGETTSWTTIDFADDFGNDYDVQYNTGSGWVNFAFNAIDIEADSDCTVEIVGGGPMQVTAQPSVTCN